MKKVSLSLLLGAVLLTGCSVGPDYERPAAVALPLDWRWKKAEPMDQMDKGPWWQLFQEPELNQLEAAATTDNQNLKAAVARVNEARAQARLTGAEFFPSLTAAPMATRIQLPRDNPQVAGIGSALGGIGGGGGAAGGTSSGVSSTRPLPYNSFTVPLDLSYELDLWGRVRRSFESVQAQAQASVADYQNVLLTLQTDVATEFFTLREYDSEIKILTATVEARKESLRINHVRVQAGRATQLDVAQAETDLHTAESQRADTQRSRAETMDALALLCGTNTQDLHEPSRSLEPKPPIIPVGLPSSLLERRPDVAEAERTMASKNALIGVAYAAFFPSVSLTGQGGYESAHLSDLFHWQNSIWSFGPSISLPLFDGGQNLSNLQNSRAQYNESVANYRNSVLTAVKDVEDALADLKYLNEESVFLRQAVASARQATDLQTKLFRVGQSNYTDVVTANEMQLADERNESQVNGQRFYATVRLIKALGGGWHARELEPEQPAPIPFNAQVDLPKN